MDGKSGSSGPVPGRECAARMQPLRMGAGGRAGWPQSAMTCMRVISHMPPVRVDTGTDNASTSPPGVNTPLLLRHTLRHRVRVKRPARHCHGTPAVCPFLCGHRSHSASLRKSSREESMPPRRQVAMSRYRALQKAPQAIPDPAKARWFPLAEMIRNAFLVEVSKGIPKR